MDIPNARSQFQPPLQIFDIADIDVGGWKLDPGAAPRFDLRGIEVDIDSRELAQKGVAFGLCREHRGVELH